MPSARNLPRGEPYVWVFAGANDAVPFDQLRLRNYDSGMIAMAVQDDWVSVTRAAAIAGCTEQYLRAELARYRPRDGDGNPVGDRSTGGRIEGWLANGRAWLVLKRSAEELRETLSTRARGKRTKPRKAHGTKAAKRKKTR
jgi:hypothetical protein